MQYSSTVQGCASVCISVSNKRANHNIITNHPTKGSPNPTNLDQIINPTQPSHVTHPNQTPDQPACLASYSYLLLTL